MGSSIAVPSCVAVRCLMKLCGVVMPTPGHQGHLQTPPAKGPCGTSRLGAGAAIGGRTGGGWASSPGSAAESVCEAASSAMAAARRISASGCPMSCSMPAEGESSDISSTPNCSSRATLSSTRRR